MSGRVVDKKIRDPVIVKRTFVPAEPLPCVAFNRMAARFDAVYGTEEISKTEYDEGMKKYKDGSQVEGVDYFIGGKKKKQKIIFQQGNITRFISFVLAEGRAGPKRNTGNHS